MPLSAEKIEKLYSVIEHSQCIIEKRADGQDWITIGIEEGEQVAWDYGFGEIIGGVAGLVGYGKYAAPLTAFLSILAPTPMGDGSLHPEDVMPINLRGVDLPKISDTLIHPDSRPLNLSGGQLLNLIRKAEQDEEMKGVRGLLPSKLPMVHKPNRPTVPGSKEKVKPGQVAAKEAASSSIVDSKPVPKNPGVPNSTTQPVKPEKPKAPAAPIPAEKAKPPQAAIKAKVLAPSSSVDSRITPRRQAVSNPKTQPINANKPKAPAAPLSVSKKASAATVIKAPTVSASSIPQPISKSQPTSKSKALLVEQEKKKAEALLFATTPQPVSPPPVALKLSAPVTIKASAATIVSSPNSFFQQSPKISVSSAPKIPAPPILITPPATSLASKASSVPKLDAGQSKFGNFEPKLTQTFQSGNKKTSATTATSNSSTRKAGSAKHVVIGNLECWHLPTPVKALTKNHSWEKYRVTDAQGLYCRRRGSKTDYKRVGSSYCAEMHSKFYSK